LVLIAESDIRQGDIGIEGGILIMPTFQVLDYLNGFFSPSGDRVSIAEVGVECPAVPRKSRSLSEIRRWHDRAVAFAPALGPVLVLRELEELSYRQISDITDLPIGTVMSRLARARRAFGDAWRRETDDGA